MSFIMYESLKVGDRFEMERAPGVVVEVIGEAVEVIGEAEDHYDDMICKPVKRIMCRAHGSPEHLQDANVSVGGEGFISYGEGGGFRGRVIA